MKSVCLILLLALGATPACSRFSASGRQERAYAKYVNKMRGKGKQRQARPRHVAPQMPKPETMTPSEPRETTKMLDSPRAVPSNPDGQ